MSRALIVASVLVAACAGPASDAPDAGDPTPPDSDKPRCIAAISDRQWGGPRDDNASVSISRDGAVYVFGSTGGSANDDSDPGVFARAFLDRYEGNTRAWSYAPSSMSSIDIVEPGDGTLDVVGRGADAEQFDLVIGSLSTNGVAGDFERAGIAPSERPLQLLADGDRRAIVGYHDIYIPTNYVDAWQDPFVFRWSAAAGPAAGTMTTLHSAEPDIATGATFAADGSLLVAGATLSGKGSWVRPSTAGFEAPAWSLVGDLEELRAIHRLPDGDFLLAGTTMHSLGGALGGQDVYVTRLAPDLATTRWIAQLGSAADDRALDLVVDDAGRSWLLGETTGDVAAPNAGEADLFVIALDSSGTERWRAQRGSPGDERPSGLAVDACENVLVAGATNGALVAPAAGYDAFLVSVH